MLYIEHALQIFCISLLYIFQYLDFDNLPETNFTCTGKVIGGYYADLETSCQMFHVCTVGQNDEPMDIKFLCLNGTVFDQVSFLTYLLFSLKLIYLSLLCMSHCDNVEFHSLNHNKSISDKKYPLISGDKSV